jgi:predicted AlkP superfamily pyrophosphatase or phosphodiesterase
LNGFNEQIKWPDYGQSSISLTGSIAAFFGLDAPYGSLTELDKWLTGNYRNVVLLVLDGLGSQSLAEALAEDSFLRRNKVRDLSAVYPSTTVAATASLRTGYPPARHGRLGWTMYFPQIKRSVDVYSNRLQYTDEQASTFHAADTFVPLDELAFRINACQSAQACSISAHDKVCAKDFDELHDHILKRCLPAGRHYLYAYFNEPDSSMHVHGVHSAQAKQWIRDLDRRCESLRKAMPEDSLFIITADHGLIDTRPVIVEDSPSLARMLIRPPVLEPRAAALYVKEKDRCFFPEAFHQAFGDAFLLISTEETIRQKIFGPGQYLPGLEQYLGDFLALAISDAALYQKTQHCRLIGMHAGLTPAEMMVPLIAAG